MTFFSPIAFDNFDRYKTIQDQAISVDSASDSKEVLVLLRQKDLSPSSQQLLEKILGAINYSPEVVNTVVVPNESLVDISRLIHRCQPKLILSFEVNLNKNGLNIEQKLYQTIYLLQTNIIISEALTTLEGDKNRKLKLWNCLKSYA